MQLFLERLKNSTCPNMKLNKTETRKTLVQLVKYGVIGASNTLITLASFYVLNSQLGVPYTFSNVIGYVLGVVNSFVWNRTWVFKAKSNLKREAVLFIIGFLACWVLQMAVSVFLLEGLRWKSLPQDIIPFFPMEKPGQNIVMVIAMVFYTLANYIYNRMVTFKEQEKQ